MLDQEQRMVTAAQGGDDAAFSWLFVRHFRTVAQSVRRFVVDDHAAQDVAQEAFLRALDNLDRLQGETRFEGWVVRIARNIAVDASRRQRSKAEVELDDPDALHTAELVRDSELDPGPLRAVWDAVLKLPEHERRMMLLFYGRGMSIEQTARECGVRSTTVKVALHRTRRRVRRMIVDA